MNNWEPYKLGDICTIKGGKRLPMGHELTSTVTKHPYIKARDIRNGKVSTDNLEYISETTHNLISRYIVKANDVCITIVANIGDAGIIPFELNNANLTENALRLTSFSKKVDPKFLCYVLSSKTYKSYCESLAAGAAQAKLGIYKVKTLNLILPPLPEQRRIASILSAYDELIENNSKRISILEQIAEQIYKEWFVRFRFPGYEKAEFEKGVPKGWEWRNIKDVTSIVTRGVPPSYDDVGDFLAVNQKCIRDGKLNMELCRRHSKVFPKTKQLCFGDVLINSTGEGTVGRVGQVYFSPEKTTVDTHVSIVRPDTTVNIDYFGFNLISLQDYFAFMAVGSTNQTELSRDTINRVKILLPDYKLQSSFSEIVRPIRLNIFNLKQTNQNLRQTRDLLLPRLISGKLKVKDIEAN
jgi:type I restriction enzyme S subunit